MRFIYALPLAFAYLITLLIYNGEQVPNYSTVFIFYCLSGGLCQIAFTVLLLWLFSFHNFAVGTTFSKLETVMVAIFGLLLLGDSLSALVIIAITLSTVGLILLSAAQSRLTPGNLLSALWSKPTLIGLACAASLGASVVFFRAASLSLNLENPLLAASFTLVVVLIIQTASMGLWMAVRDRENLIRVFVHWRPAAAVGLSGGLTSIGWFSAFTLQNATHVRALGQIELLFTFIATVFFFREKIAPAELIGIALITSSIILILLA